MAFLIFLHTLVNSKWILFLFPIFAIFTIAAFYEIIEWIYAILSDPAAGAAFLGSQGDIWDAQKDILADALGSVFATIFFFKNKPTKTIKAHLTKNQ
jgi:putative membrane protein